MDTPAEISISPMRGAMTIGAVTAGAMLVVGLFKLQILGWLVFIGGIYYSMIIYRKVLGGIIVYTKALNIGIQTAFFASLILAFVAYMNATLEPSSFLEIIDAAEEQMKTSTMQSKLDENIVQRWREILTPTVFGVIIIFMYSMIGGLAALIFAFFARNAKQGEFVEY